MYSSSSSSSTTTANGSTTLPSSSRLSSYLRITPSPKPSYDMRSYSSSIPFSWESKPGIPKNMNHHHPKHPIDGPDHISAKHPTRTTHQDILLPLPPPLKPTNNHSSFLKNVRADPFTMALMEFSKVGDLEEEGKNIESSSLVQTQQRGRTRRLLLEGRFMPLDLLNDYFCKKTAVAVADSNVYIIRNRRSSRAYDLLHRRQ